MGAGIDRAWLGPIITGIMAIVIALIPVEIAEREALIRISGTQPGFARVLGGERFGDQIEFVDSSGTRCVLSTVKARSTRERIIAGNSLAVDCYMDTSPAQAFAVQVDGDVVVAYEDTERRLRFEQRARIFGVGLLGLITLVLAIRVRRRKSGAVGDQSERQ